MDDAAILFVRLAGWTEDDDRDLPRRGYGYREGMGEIELRDSARAWWVISQPRAEGCRYLAAVADGTVRGVWEIRHDTWRSIDGLRLGRSPRRWGVDVARAPANVWDELVGRPTPMRRDGRPLFGRGSVIAYWP